MKNQTEYQWFKSIIKTEEFQGVLLAFVFFNVVHLVFLGLTLIGLVKLAQWIL